MEITNIAILIGIVVLAVFLILAKRLIRLAVRLMLAGLIFIALLAGLSIAWWQGWFNRQPAEKNPPRPSPTRRVTSR